MTTKTSNKRALPFTLRLMPEERATLEYEAAGMPLGEYIRMRALDKNRIKRRTRGKYPVKDHILLKAENNGSLAPTPEIIASILEACSDIRDIKQKLIASLRREE